MAELKVELRGRSDSKKITSVALSDIFGCSVVVTEMGLKVEKILDGIILPLPLLEGSIKISKILAKRATDTSKIWDIVKEMEDKL